MPHPDTLFLKIILIAAISLAAAPVEAGPDDESAEHLAASETEGAAAPAMTEITAPLIAPPEIVTPPPEFAGTAPASSKDDERAPRLRDCDDKRTWHCGVSAEDQERALELYEQGNQFFDDNDFFAAVARYRAALAHWNHPAIHYNLMLALVGLDQPIEAFQASTEALRYGVQALKLEEYHRAVDYQRLLRRQIASLEVTCNEPGAVVSVDGKEVLQGPGTIHLLMRPGQHEVAARKDGYLTTHHTIVTVSEKPVSLKLRLLPQAKAMVPVRRRPAWQPWAVVSTGVGIGLVGGALEWRADVNNRLFQSSFAKHCENDPALRGCYANQYTPEMKSQWTRYTWYRRVGHGASIAGGMAALSGLVLVYLNREQHIENPERRNLVHISVTPTITSDATGLSMNLAF